MIGKSILLETDHKSLIPLLRKTSLDCFPPRVLRFRLCLMRFNCKISHVPGKFLYTADALSHKLVSPLSEIQIEEVCQTEIFVHSIISSLPASSDRLDAYRNAQQQDNVCSRLIVFCKNGWPQKKNFPPDIMPYWQLKSELSLYDNLLLRGKHIAVPRSMQKETLEKIYIVATGVSSVAFYGSHRSSVWWPQVK